MVGHVMRTLPTSGCPDELCERPEAWEWSSFCHYATDLEGAWRWNLNGFPKSASELPPLKPKNGLNGPPVRALEWVVSIPSIRLNSLLLQDILLPFTGRDVTNTLTA